MSPINIYGNKEFARKPECPFCGLSIEKPKELKTRRWGEMPVGSCSCGAVYAYDVTGHNLGSAFIEALVFGCNMDWDLAWNLFPEEDYLEKIVENYDSESHLIIPSGSYEGRKIPGALYFIRLDKDIREVTSQGVQRKLEAAKPVEDEPAPSWPVGKRFSKSEIEDLAKKYQVDMLISIARHDKRIIRDLQRLLYSGDELLRMRTADIIGKVSGVIAKKDPGTISNLLQRLLNAVSAPGASSWGAIDTIGEIIYNAPDLFMGYIPTMYQLLEDDAHRPKVIKAIGRAAQARPDLIKNAIFRFIPFLSHPEPETRGNAAWLLGNLGALEARAELELLKDDGESIEVYTGGEIEKVSIGQLASEALAKLEQKTQLN